LKKLLTAKGAESAERFWSFRFGARGLSIYCLFRHRRIFDIDDLGFGGENSYSISECGVKNNGKWTKSNKFAAGRL
jgi:hypothetical protein